MNAKLVGFKMVGARYNPSSGLRLPGYTMVTIRYDDGTEITKWAGGEDKTMAQIRKELNDQGVYTSAMDHWVRTGEWKA